MKMIECVAVDDEPIALEVIERFCRRISYINLRTFSDPKKAALYLTDNTPDILFLDIRMPEMSGFDIASSIEKIPYIIFTTAYEEYALQSYNYNSVDYLLKPYNFERFSKAVNKTIGILNSLQEEDDKLVVSIEHQKVFIRKSDILYVESMGNYVKMYTSTQTYMPQLSMTTIQTMLEERGFIRVHRSFLVQKAAVKSYHNQMVTVADKEIPVGKKYHDGVLAELGLMGIV